MGWITYVYIPLVAARVRQWPFVHHRLRDMRPEEPRIGTAHRPRVHREGDRDGVGISSLLSWWWWWWLGYCVCSAMLSHILLMAWTCLPHSNLWTYPGTRPRPWTTETANYRHNRWEPSIISPQSYFALQALRNEPCAVESMQPIGPLIYQHISL